MPPLSLNPIPHDFTSGHRDCLETEDGRPGTKDEWRRTISPLLYSTVCVQSARQNDGFPPPHLSDPCHPNLEHDAWEETKTRAIIGADQACLGCLPLPFYSPLFYLERRGENKSRQGRGCMTVHGTICVCLLLCCCFRVVVTAGASNLPGFNFVMLYFIVRRHTAIMSRLGRSSRSCPLARD